MRQKNDEKKLEHEERQWRWGGEVGECLLFGRPEIPVSAFTMSGNELCGVSSAALLFRGERSGEGKAAVSTHTDKLGSLVRSSY